MFKGPGRPEKLMLSNTEARLSLGEVKLLIQTNEDILRLPGLSRELLERIMSINVCLNVALSRIVHKVGTEEEHCQPAEETLSTQEKNKQ